MSTTPLKKKILLYSSLTTVPTAKILIRDLDTIARNLIEAEIYGVEEDEEEDEEPRGPFLGRLVIDNFGRIISCESPLSSGPLSTTIIEEVKKELKRSGWLST